LNHTHLNAIVYFQFLFVFQLEHLLFLNWKLEIEIEI